MSPQLYHHNHFKNDFDKFMRHANPHNHPDGVYISIQSFKNLDFINPENRKFFLYYFSFIILLDQAIYTYFKQEYPEFQKKTQYPKVEYGITGVNINPWDLANLAGGLGKDFEDFCGFIIGEYGHLLKTIKIKSLGWAAIRGVIFKDPNIAKRMFGEIFLMSIKQSLKRKI